MHGNIYVLNNQKHVRSTTNLKHLNRWCLSELQDTTHIRDVDVIIFASKKFGKEARLPRRRTVSIPHCAARFFLSTFEVLCFFVVNFWW